MFGCKIITRSLWRNLAAPYRWLGWIRHRGGEGGTPLSVDKFILKVDLKFQIKGTLCTRSNIFLHDIPFLRWKGADFTPRGAVLTPVHGIWWVKIAKTIKINLRDLNNQVDSLEFAVYA